MSDDVFDVKVRRMLAAFESDLPSHDLGFWRIERQPDAVTVENENPRNLGGSSGRGFSIRGEAKCVRCHKRYEIPRIGNFHWAFEWSQEREDSLIASAKAWVERIAERDGPCWGDVPEDPKPRNVGFAVLDGVTS